MTEPVDPAGENPSHHTPVVIDYGQMPETVSPKRVLGKTAAVFMALGSVFFTVLGIFAILVACLEGAGAAAGAVAGVLFFGIAGAGLVATSRLNEAGKPRNDVVGKTRPPSGAPGAGRDDAVQ
jgi:hypothetical protein